MANSTNAKDIAIYFFKSINKIAVGKDYAITINQAKHLLDLGYSFEDILLAIDYYKENPPSSGFYSLGYLNKSIDKALIQKKKDIEKQKLKEMEKKEYNRGEVNERNREKVRRNNSSGFGKKYNFDMFKEPRENN
jgi:DNA-binding transcriptional MerR regulator